MLFKSEATTVPQIPGSETIYNYFSTIEPGITDGDISTMKTGVTSTTEFIKKRKTLNNNTNMMFTIESDLKAFVSFRIRYEDNLE